jgi:hypothetical protein
MFGSVQFTQYTGKVYMDRTFGKNSGKSVETPSLLSKRNPSSLITPRQRQRFITRIFHRDKKDFQKFFALLKNIRSYKDASILMDFYFYKNEIDPMSKEALDFKNIIFYAYSPDDRDGGD